MVGTNFLFQCWIGGLRNYDDDLESTASTSNLSMRDNSLNRSMNSNFSVSERLLTPTAASRAKRYTPEGGESTEKSYESDDNKLRRRTLSMEHINRLAAPRMRNDKSSLNGDGDRGRISTSPAPNVRNFQK
jgi:hypothetical protein